MVDAVAADVAVETKRPETSFATRLAYGFGSVAFGVKDNGFSYFLLLFYSQVVGIDARLVSLAITIALVFDAFSDPIVGYWSDNTHSRWGRRHPFMYAAALPVALSYMMLWRPPVGWNEQETFWYLLVLAVIIRVCITVYETPSSALAPELTSGYDERSTLASFRLYFAWTGGNFMSVLMFAAIFPAFVTATIPNGQFNRESYALYGMIASALIFVAILVSAAGTHSRIPYLHAPAKRRLTPLVMLREIWETLSNRSFVALFVSTVFAAIAGGLSAALAFYFLTYFWGFTSVETSFVTMSVFVSAIIGAVLAPVITRTLGKKRGAIIMGLIAFLGSPVPVLLRLLDILPANGSPFVFRFVLITTMIDVGLIICYQALISSMMADLVEQAQVRTGRRSEGIFFSAATFIRKMVSGLGVISAGFVLTAAHLSRGLDPTQVPPEALWRLGAFYVPMILSMWMSMIAVIAFYRLDRNSHAENLRKIAETKKAE